MQRKALAGFQPVNPVVCWLRCPSPVALAENALHRVQRGLDEVIQVPDLIRGARRGEPEIDPDGEPGVLRPDPGGGHRGSNGLFPRTLIGCGERGRASGHLDPNQMPARHGLRISRRRRPVPMPDLDQGTVPFLVAITSRIGWLPDLSGRRLEGRIWPRGRPTGEAEADLPGRRRPPPQTWPPGAEGHAHPAPVSMLQNCPFCIRQMGTTKCRRGAPIGGYVRASIMDRRHGK